jgi:hypothetical protein
VGAYTESRSVQVSLAERWNGTEWAVQTSSNPAGSENTVLQNVSCAGETSCIAAGDWLNRRRWSTLAESWNGTEWLVETTPNRAEATFDILEGVSCRQLTCLAVGWSTNAEARNTTTGTIRTVPSWSQQAIESFVFNEEQRGVSCTASNACISVGYAEYIEGIEGRLLQFARTFNWNGTSWSLAGNPAPRSSVYSELQDVSCTASNACTAVGGYQLSGGSLLPYAARWNGTAWTIQTVPTPARTRTASLRDVSCTSATACTAVGSYTTEAGVTQTLAEAWNGTSWSVQSTPAAGTSSVLHSVSCVSSSECVAAGEATTEGSRQPLAMHWNGTSWTTQRTSLPAGGTIGGFEGVSCTTASACTAAGDYKDAASFQYTYAARWDGTSWTAQTTPNPPFTQGGLFQDVTCVSATACIAVGDHVEARGVLDTLAAAWDGTRWELHSTPNAGSRGNLLGGVTCISSTSCRAVGYKEGGANRENMVESYP